MRIISRRRLHEYAQRHSIAKSSLENWEFVVRHAHWQRFPDVRATFRSADTVRLPSGRTVVIFNISGNRFRLITAIHFNTAKIYILRFLTHAKYDKETWKTEL